MIPWGGPPGGAHDTVASMGRARALALVVAATAVWGATFIVVKRGLTGNSPLTFLALRFLIAAAVLLPLLRSRGVRAPRSAWPYACGAALFAGYAFQTLGLATTTPARSAFITALSVVLVPLLEPVFAINRVSWRALAGAAVSIVGLAVLLRPETAPPSAGDWLTLGCAVAFAFHGILLQGAVRRAPPAAVNAAQVLTTTALALPAAAAAGWQVTFAPWTVAALAITGVLATVAAFWAMTEAQRALTAAETALVLAFEPVVAAVVSVLGGADVVTASLIGGGALVVLGVVVATVRSSPPNAAASARRAADRRA
jgi:drug/metabolite transporter (DMT)-like permease